MTHSPVAIIALWGTLLHASGTSPNHFQTPVATDTPVDGRLRDNVRPIRYVLDLQVRPTTEGFSGTTEIDVEVTRTASAIWLHGVDLSIGSATINQDGRTTDAVVSSHSPGLLKVVPTSPIPAGRATLSIKYSAPFSKTSDGLYRVREKDDWYAFTHFEPEFARRMFPVFDEPRFVTPYEITLRVLDKNRAFANAPLLEESLTPDGQIRFRFAPSKPMPSYLVAIAVGPFDIMERGRVGVNNVPFRFIAPKGRGSETQYASEIAPQLLRLVEAYFDIPYPYEKLDMLAVPGGHGDEFPGLIRFGVAEVLTAAGVVPSVARQRQIATVSAHELAHMWMGNLVTLSWWDDSWLKEGSATWLADKILEQWRPEWRVAASRET